MPFLKVIKGGFAGQVIELAGNRMVLGRHPNCEIVLDDAAVSRHHAQILQSHGNFYLEDLRSRNRTFLNNIAIQGRTELHDDDELKICDIVFTFHNKLPADSGAASSSSWQKVPQRQAIVGDGSDADSSSKNLLVGTEPEHDSGNSSIISTINAKHESGLRLGVKPEVKLRAILSIGQALAQTFQIDEVLEKTLDELFKIFPQADEGFVLLHDEKSEKLIVSATKTRSGDADDSVRISTTIVEKAMAECEAILSHDASQDARFDKSDSLNQLRIRSMICVPLVDTEGTAIGVIQLDAKDLRNRFDQEDLDVLVSVASQVTLAVQNARMHEQVVKQRDISEQMGLAVQVQLEFLPDRPPELPGYEFFDYYEAALEVGGDYFDYVELSDGRVAVMLGDVAGKGVPAALLMAKLSASARAQVLAKPTVGEALSGINAEINSRGLGHRFVTMVIVMIDPKTNRITVGNAGHLPVLMRRKDGTVVEIANEVAGTPLGIEPDQKYEDIEYPLHVGDIILLHTDGITEAMDPDQEVYGRRRLKEFIEQGPKDIKDLGEGILQDVEAFSTVRLQRDDICLVGIQRTSRRRNRDSSDGAPVS